MSATRRRKHRAGRRRLRPKATTIGLGLIIALLVVNMLVSERSTSRLLRNEHRVVQT
jgi:hypothetical protein